MPSSLPKNLNVYWTLCVILGFWFLFIHTPPVLIARDAIGSVRFMAHLLAVFSIYFACIVNVIFTPSTLGGKARTSHVWIGRYAMIAGIVVFASGAAMSWIPFGALPIPFASFITALGCIGLFAQYFGFTAIKRYQKLGRQIEAIESENPEANDTPEDLDTLKEQREAALRSHIFHMVMLFVVGCGFPAALRLSYLFGTYETIALLVLYASLAFMVKPYSKTYIRPSPTDQEDADETTKLNSSITTALLDSP